jgi:hypothetical protein
MLPPGHPSRLASPAAPLQGLAGERGRRPMSKPESSASDVRAEYDFSGGTRGKYADRYARGSNVVALEPDVAAAFPTAEAVNAALRDHLREHAERGKTGV